MSETRRGWRRASTLLVLAAVLPLAGVSECRNAPYLAVVPIATALDRPVYVAAPAGDPRLFVVERAGRIRILDPVTRTVGPVFLDITNRVVSNVGDRGLLSLAFAPDYAESGHFYVTFTNASNRIFLARFVADDPAGDFVNPTSEFDLIAVLVEGTSSLGGALRFGPHDGMLYMSVGDARTLITVPGSPQLLNVHAGKILRLDVRGGPRQPFAIPPDNPFVGVAGARPEIWALGVHDPRRLDFDPDTGDLWFTDPGRSLADEVNALPAGAGGLNLGWPTHEGDVCANSFPSAPCQDPGAPVSFTFPVYTDANMASCRMVGGILYAAGNPELRGGFAFANSCTRHVFLLPPIALPDMSAVDVTRLLMMGGEPFFGDVTSLASDGFGEPHLVSRDDGVVYRIQVGYDIDDDGIGEPGDNCPLDSNRDQADADGDGEGDVCDGAVNPS